MTNRRPDINCDGCGSYCYSLSHRSWEQKFPKYPFYCKNCQKSVSKGIKNSKMADFEWYKKSEGLIDDLKSEGDLNKLERSIIGSFVCTIYDSPYNRPKKKVYAHRKIKEMSLQEWKELSLQKLEYFKEYCDKKELTMVKKFIQRAPN